MALSQISQSDGRLMLKTVDVTHESKDDNIWSSSRKVTDLGLTVNVARLTQKDKTNFLQTKATESKTNTKQFDPEADYKFDSSDDEEHGGQKSPGMEEKYEDYYRKVCKKLKVVPCNSVIKQFGHSFISIKDCNLHLEELKAFFMAITSEMELTKFELGGNKLGVREITYALSVVSVHKALVNLVLEKCDVNGQVLKCLADFMKTNDTLQVLDLSDNKVNDRDAEHIAAIIQSNESIHELILRRNDIGDGAEIIGNALSHNDTIATIDLSWNNIRSKGAIGLCHGLMKNTGLKILIAAWNGFGCDGCAALAHCLIHNTTLTTVDLTCNRIHPPALFELVKGLEKNKTLVTLKLGCNPITPPMTSIFLNRLLKSSQSGLKELDLEGVTVDKEFQTIVDTIQEKRIFLVRYKEALPMNKGEVYKIDPTNIFDIDPVRILMFMKEHMRSIDCFLKLDKDGSSQISREEMEYAFELEGYPVSSSVLDQVMTYLEKTSDSENDVLGLTKEKIVAEADRMEKCILDKSNYFLESLSPKKDS
ncbi:hypothetical protein CHS0354_018613 [Potamilus streckersoni]|uniref:EF-hand domain-containing protein n=1 Tax=Potamilus streckersoni TaxID=2493646 RepID=A0AAE0VXF5_9BIVA|nr:hypothetical protein CHS0354_018613 [Potamilus streckersoni]